jgi:hypothetical protein
LVFPPREVRGGSTWNTTTATQRSQWRRAFTFSPGSFLQPAVFVDAAVAARTRARRCCQRCQPPHVRSAWTTFASLVPRLSTAVGLAHHLRAVVLSRRHAQAARASFPRRRRRRCCEHGGGRGERLARPRRGRRSSRPAASDPPLHHRAPSAGLFHVEHDHPGCCRLRCPVLLSSGFGRAGPSRDVAFPPQPQRRPSAMTSPARARPRTSTHSSICGSRAHCPRSLVERDSGRWSGSGATRPGPPCGLTGVSDARARAG